jgi:hypothetical protein
MNIYSAGIKNWGIAKLGFGGQKILRDVLLFNMINAM